MLHLFLSRKSCSQWVPTTTMGTSYFEPPSLTTDIPGDFCRHTGGIGILVGPCGRWTRKNFSRNWRSTRCGKLLPPLLLSNRLHVHANKLVDPSKVPSEKIVNVKILRIGTFPLKVNMHVCISKFADYEQISLWKVKRYARAQNWHSKAIHSDCSQWEM